MTKSTCKTIGSGIFFSLLFSIVLIEYAFAHKVIVFAWVEGDIVHTESKFNGGKKAINAPIEVFDALGNKLLEGKTNENGEFSFKAPQKTEMKIVLIAGMGHRGEWTITSDEFGEEIEKNSEIQPSQKSDSAQTSLMTKSNMVSEQNNSICPCLTSEAIQIIVEKTLDKKMKPLVTKINKLLAPDSSPDISDIFAGIGYIFGLMGIGAYFNYRRKKE